MNSLTTIDQALETFNQYATSRFDKTHGAQHGIDVWNNAQAIILTDYAKFASILSSEFWYKALMLATVSHDWGDSKYRAHGLTISDCEYKNFVDTYLGPGHWEAYYWLVNNVSWSSQSHQQVPPEGLDETWMLIKHVVQDADWLEALGLVGIERCQDYIKFYKPQGDKYTLEEETKLYIDNKLRLIPCALYSDTAKEIAEGLMQIIEDYYRSH